jgi:uncharacterized protein with NRDE domain
MVNAFLTPSSQEISDTQAFVKKLITGEGAKGSGGFSLVCGRIGQRLAVVSNRIQEEGEVKWIGDAGVKETVGLSNAAFGDQTWEKVASGERKLRSLIGAWSKQRSSREEMTNDLFDLLSIDTLPRKEGEHWDVAVKQLRNSIFIPKLDGQQKPADEVAAADSEARLAEQKATTGAYGTQKQTVLIVDREGFLSFTEKTLYDEHGNDIRGTPQSIRSFKFQIT